MNKKIITIIIITIILLASTIIYLINIPKEEIENKDEEIIISFDDQINPYTYQGLTVEILRMRNRGILDKIFTVGNSWKNPPVYYFIVDVDGEIGNASKLEAAGGIKGEGTFNEWDTMLKE